MVSSWDDNIAECQWQGGLPFGLAGGLVGAGGGGGVSAAAAAVVAASAVASAASTGAYWLAYDAQATVTLAQWDLDHEECRGTSAVRSTQTECSPWGQRGSRSDSGSGSASDSGSDYGYDHVDYYQDRPSVYQPPTGRSSCPLTFALCNLEVGVCCACATRFHRDAVALEGRWVGPEDSPLTQLVRSDAAEARAWLAAILLLGVRHLAVVWCLLWLSLV
jgi:hypothetical protein